jgi:hypothetical protein
VLQRILFLDLVLPEIVMVHIARYVKYPRPEVTLSPKEIPIFQDSEKNVLNKVLAQFRIFIHSIEESIQRSFVALKQQP